MLGLLEGKRGTLPLLAAACVGVLALVPAVGAAHAPSVSSLQAENADLVAKSRAAVLDLYSLDARLATAQQRLAALHAAGGRLAQQRDALRQEVRLARVDTTVSQKRLAARLRFIYEHGTTSSLEVLMGARSLDDALTQLDDYHRIADANASVLVQVTSSRRHLHTLQRSIAARTVALAATTAEAAQTVAELQQLRGERMAYVSSLESRRSLDTARIARLTTQAEAAVVRTQTLTARQPQLVAPAPAAVPVAAETPVLVSTETSGRTLTVVATGYDLPGHTSTGLPVGWGIAAVDPSVIPLGTRIVVPGYGVAVAADTGGAIVGATIDLWFPSAAQAYDWGRRTVTISIDQA